MGMTITEKILARAAGKEKVAPGQLIDAKIELVSDYLVRYLS